MKLFQFWHADPPEDVFRLMEATRESQSDFEYIRLDARTGRAFVGEHYGARGLSVWDACALPAMWSDFLRLLLMDVYGGVYVDATYEFSDKLSDIVADAPVGQLPAFATVVNNNYLMIREPGNAFVRACIMLLMDNVENRRFDSVLMAVGPGVLNSVRCVASPEERPGITALCESVEDWVRWDWRGSVANADRLIAPTDELKNAYHGLSLIQIEQLSLRAKSFQFASHRRRHDHWYRWRGGLYL